MIKLPRLKKRNLLLIFAYKIEKIIPLRKKTKIRFFLDLAWIFSRLAHENIYKTDLKKPNELPNRILESNLSEDFIVLDLGCGDGAVSRFLYPNVKKVIGVDFSKPSIETAKALSNNTTIEFIHDDIFLYLEQNQKQFDLIVLSHVVEHIDNPALLLKTLSNYTKYLYIEVPDIDSSHLNAYRIMLGSNLTYTDADHVFEFDRYSLQDIIEEAGYSIIESEYIYGNMRFWCSNKIMSESP